MLGAKLRCLTCNRYTPDRCVCPFVAARFCEPNGYEVSSVGDRRFSALFARLEDGRTIEEAYQLDINGYRATTNDWRMAKGKPPLVRRDTWPEYLALWQQWAGENPELMRVLYSKARGKVLTDRFASTRISQARALAEILNTMIPKEGTNGPSTFCRSS